MNGEIPHEAGHTSEHLENVWEQPVWEVERHRRLIGSETDPSRVGEFYSPTAETRYIALPAGSDQARLHEHMLEERLPVFSALYAGDHAFLHVPLDARPLSGVIGMAHRDIGMYGELLKRAGRMIRQVEKAGFGLPVRLDGRSILGGLAFSTDNEDSFGVRLHMVPPYSMNTAINAEQLLTAVNLELQGNRRLHSEVASSLMACFQQGYRECSDDRA